MRAPILNDRGQFRYSDFVAYIPEFLKSEPDVVTLLQVFSDYINNAYRNIDTVEKFEFTRVVRSGRVDGMVKTMDMLRTMLDLAGARNDYVNLLSVPRANVKSNAVFGRDSGYLPYIMNYDTPVVTDRIENVSTIDASLEDFTDGDVVYVNYIGLEGGEKQIAYYYDSISNSLIRDPMGNSQDPFTGTDNTSSRILSFHVSDVSSVKKRYGYTTKNGEQFYEVFFTARIYDVSSANAVKEIDLPGVSQSIIDYYGTETAPEGKMISTVRFGTEHPWAWHDGFPTGLIYLSETSGAQLASVGFDNKSIAPADNCTGPEYIEALPRYPIIGKPVIDSGVVTVELSIYYPAYANGTVYIISRKNSDILGEFNVIKDSREHGKMDLRLVPTGSLANLESFLDTISGTDDSNLLYLVEVPLFYEKGILDYTQASPIIKMDKVYPFKNGGVGIYPSESLCAYACDSKENPAIGTLNIVRKDSPDRKPTDAYLDGGYTIVIPYVSELAKHCSASRAQIYDSCGFGDSIYLEWNDPVHEKYWSGLASVRAVYRMADGVGLFLNGIQPIRPADLGDCSAVVHVLREGYLVISGGQIKDARVYGTQEGLVELKSDNGTSAVAMMYEGPVFVDANGNNIILPDGEYSVTKLSKNTDRVRNLLSVDTSTEGVITTEWKRSRGDMFTCKYVILEDSEGRASIAHTLTDVKEFAIGKYTAGDYIYDATSKKVYKCVKDCNVTDPTIAANSNVFVEDRISHYSVPYSSLYNIFMPFYGPYSALEFGSKVDYSVDREVFTAPLYITKVEDKELKYGWEHREFLNYGDTLNLMGRARNGMVELHSTTRTNSSDTSAMSADADMDIVDSDLLNKATWSYTHEVVNNGDTPKMSVDIDDAYALSAERVNETTWKVTVHSSAHGLVDGSLVTVSGLKKADLYGKFLDLNVQYVPVNVIDGDKFTYEVYGDASLRGSTCFAELTNASEIVYIRDHYAFITAITRACEGTECGCAKILLPERLYGPAAGDELYLDGCLDDNGNRYPDGPYVVKRVNDDGTEIILDIGCNSLPVIDGVAIVRKTITSGDVVVILDSDTGVPVKFYEVDSGIWGQVERNALITPLDLYSQSNLFDITTTNPAIALGDAIVIKDILYSDGGKAVVHIASPILHFTAENREYIEGKTLVYISNVTPSDYNGLHTVTKILSPTSFEISMRLFNDYALSGIATGDRRMLLQECRWYKYTIDEIEWDKTSSIATYMGHNRITQSGGRILTEYPHGVKVGDHVVFGRSFDAFDESTGLNGYAMGRVTSVENEMSLTVKMERGEISDGMSMARGVITEPGMDNLTNRRGEYLMYLNSLGEKYRFTNGDIVIAAGQLIPGERVAYVVREAVQWTVLKKKRIMKVRKATVDEYRNSEYLDGTVEDNMDEFKYVTYSDVDVAKASRWAYASRMFMVRNPLFNKPAIDNIDTTRNPNAEYSSGEDYANISPRDEMKSSFKGVPDLKYPLIEKIERLAYLRDANVIDYELIGYLARFMGYDLTAMSEDVETSNLYRTAKEQENAVREAVLNLPQYYALGGTNPGIKMLMSAFGVISDVLTLYTNTLHPYEEMLTKDEMTTRLLNDSADGTLEGSWVSTPYIDIELTDDARFPQFAIQEGDVARIKEQIRVWKPINVVFRDIILKYVGEIDIKQSITGPIISVEEFGSALGATDSEEDTPYLDPDYADPNLSNCAF